MALAWPLMAPTLPIMAPRWPPRRAKAFSQGPPDGSMIRAPASFQWLVCSQGRVWDPFGGRLGALQSKKCDQNLSPNSACTKRFFLRSQELALFVALFRCRLDLYGLLLVSLWLLPPHLPCFLHFFRGRRLDPAPLALFPALLPRSPLGSIWAPACAPMAFPGSVSRTSSALAAWIRMDSCLDPYYGFCRPTGPLFRTSSAGAAWIWVPALIPMASPAPLALFHALLPRSPPGSVCCMNCPLLC